MVGNDLFIRGPVDVHHAGRYLCQASYRKHLVSLRFTIEVNPKVLLPGIIFTVYHHTVLYTLQKKDTNLDLVLFSVTFPPNISVDMVEKSDHIRIECLASNAIPAANVSWVLPQEMNSTVQSDVTSYNGSFSVRSVLSVPTCLTREYVIECVVDHPVFMEQESQQIALPVCGKTLSSL